VPDRGEGGKRAAEGLLDTSVVIDLDIVDPASLPGGVAVSALTMAELAAGPHATDDPTERARRQDRLQQIESWLDPLPFDDDCARAWARVYVAVVAANRKPRGRRMGRLADRGDRASRRYSAIYPQWRRLPLPRTASHHRRGIAPGVSHVRCTNAVLVQSNLRKCSQN
jgi:predicted nucleic acid-binding protein